MVLIGNDWDQLLKNEFSKDYYLKLRNFLKHEYTNKIIYPDKNDIFNSLKYTQAKDAKVLILGQDPYINEGQAHGLSFSVKPSAKIPPSLRNIYKELQSDLNLYIPNNGYLKKWCDQGVLLLNTVLTVESKKSKSHSKKGWETFTNKIITILNEKEKPMVFLLWGNDAKSKIPLITNKKHLILTAAHPSPLAGNAFSNSKHFSKTNIFLKNEGLKEIDWQIENI